MKEHNWIVAEIESGSFGVNSFWSCADCGAGGGPYFINPKTKQPFPRWSAFLLGAGADAKLGDDCEEAKRLTEEYNKAKNPDGFIARLGASLLTAEEE